LPSAASASTLTAAALDARFTQPFSYPIVVNGLNDFRSYRNSDEPQAEWAWWGGAWDRTVGHDDQYSLRLTGGQAPQSWMRLGNMWFSEPLLAGTYTLTAWVRTQDVQGEGATIGAKLLYPDAPPVYRPDRITGTNDWQQLEFSFTLSRPAYGLAVVLDVSGTGTAWFDDVELVRG
jgi:hypothetical protein